MKRKTKGARMIILMLLIGAAASMLVQCGAPADLLGKVEARVNAAEPEPNMVLSINGDEISDGGVSSAFIDAVQGTPYDVEFTIENRGNSDLLLRESETIEFSGNDAALFSLLTSPGNLVVSPGAQTSFTVRFELDGQGEKSAQMAIYSNDPIKNPYGCILSNTALPEILINVGGVEIPSGTGSYDFGETGYGQTIDAEFTIRNLGNAELELTGAPLVSVTGDGFSLQAEPSSVIASGSSSTFTVRFDPVIIGTSSGSVTVDNNDDDENPYIFSLEGSSSVLISEKHLSAGRYHSVTCKSDGTVWTWGSNDAGQLGLGDNTERHSPVQVSGLNDVVAVAAGYGYTMALKSDGTLRSWGSNDSGQLGDGSTDNRYIPVVVTGLIDVAAVAAGWGHTIAQKSDGTVWTWGSNDAGQLGLGDNTERHSPVQITGFSDVTAVSAGGFSTMALKSTGTAWAWGANSKGQLGDGTTTSQDIPVQITEITDGAEIALGLYHTVAVEIDGKVWSWGYNSEGQLGDGSTTDSHSPVQVSGLTEVTAVSTGDYHTVALKSDGSLRSWGLNNKGQLGDGTTINRHSPVEVSGITDVVSVSAGQHHTVALKSDGTVWVWGHNDRGQLGVGDTTDRHSPVQISGLGDVVSVAAAYVHTMVLKSDGTVWAWGWNYLGQLGDGSTTERHSPVQVSIFTTGGLPINGVDK